MKMWLSVLIGVSAIVNIPFLYATEQLPLELMWGDLIPKEQRQSINPFGQRTTVAQRAQRAKQSLEGDFRHDLDGRNVSISGLIIPLEGDEKSMSELLLLPYHGACIHVPPPPPNQILYVKFAQPVPREPIWQAVTIKGELRVESTSTNLAEVGYLLDGHQLKDYTPPYLVD